MSPMVGRILREFTAGVGPHAGTAPLAWCSPVVPTSSRFAAKQRGYLEENVATSSIEPTDDETRRLEEIAPPGVSARERCPDMSTVEPVA